MQEKIALDILTRDNVSLKKQRYVVLDGKEYAIGEPWRRAYVNSIRGRKQIEAEVPEPYKSVIMLMFGDTPTVDDSPTV
jgi:hypothetical protein